MLARVTVRGLLARKARVVLTIASIVIGVSFLSGAFILTDSFRRAFDELFTRLDQGIDLRVRGATAFGRGGGGSPVPAELAEQISALDGVVAVEPDLDEPTVILDRDGQAVPARGGPQLGVSWTGGNTIGSRELRSGRPPNGIDEVAIDETTFARLGISIGDQVSIAVATGVRPFTLVGVTGLGERGDAIATRATIAAFDPVSAQVLLGSPGLYDSIDVAVADGADAAVTEAIQALLDEHDDASTIEVVSGAEVARDSAERVANAVDLLRWVLLGFAFVALFVGAFLINNTFRIIVSQRLRELALLRAIGASTRQVRTIITVETLTIAVAATALGVVAGVGVSEVLTRVFNAGGVGFPNARTVVSVRTVAVSAVVGIGITMLATISPSIAAGRVAPMAALRPELVATEHRSTRRSVIGAGLIIAGVTAYSIGVFAKPGSQTTVVAVIAVGGALVLIGAALLAAAAAAPVGRGLGRPVAAVFAMPGRLAAGNAVRSPRRTATTASALMIGIALVSGVGVVGASLTRSLSDQLGQSITADFFIGSSPSGPSSGFSADVVERLSALDELDAVSGFRAATFEVDGDIRPVGAVDADAFARIVDLDVRSGGYEGLGDNGVMVHRDPARDRGLVVGDSVDVRWRNGAAQTLIVVGIFADSTVVNSNWLVDIEVLEAANPAQRLDVFAGARIADGVTVAEAQAAVQAITGEFPQLEVQDRAEFRQAQTDQLNQLLIVVYGLLAFAVIIAVLGITNTLALAVFERTHEFGLLRAIGTTRRQLQLTVLAESVIVAAFGAVLGLAVGLPLGALGARGMRSVGVSTVVIPFSTVGIVIAATLVAGVLAAVWPARRAGRLDVLTAISRPE